MCVFVYVTSVCVLCENVVSSVCGCMCAYVGGKKALNHITVNMFAENVM